MTSQPLFQNTFTLRRSGAAKIGDIIKIAIMLIKTTSKDSIKIKELETIY